ncbi:hypothetical protein IPJ91_02580 [bacterium]|nr:MAG: hypothetical protein IPJ91_02580 [bacterium]
MLNIISVLKPYNPETKSGLIVFDKPTGITTNDLVYQVRKEYGTRKVGAAGVLDPFATGAVIIGIGNCTKDLTQFENCEKTYEFEMIFGLQTLSGDNQDMIVDIVPFRKVPNVNEAKGLSIDTLATNRQNIISTFPNSYFQEVPLLSSVKVQGHKLRELTRKNVNNIEFLSEYKFNIKTEREVNFKKSEIILKIPRRKVEIKSLELLETGTKSYNQIIQNASQEFINSFNCFLGEAVPQSGAEGVHFSYFKFKTTVSKGTYIRKLAEDIAFLNNELGCVMLLSRTSYIA